MILYATFLAVCPNIKTGICILIQLLTIEHSIFMLFLYVFSCRYRTAGRPETLNRCTSSTMKPALFLTACEMAGKYKLRKNSSVCTHSDKERALLFRFSVIFLRGNFVEVSERNEKNIMGKISDLFNVQILSTFQRCGQCTCLSVF